MRRRQWCQAMVSAPRQVIPDLGTRVRRANEFAAPCDVRSVGSRLNRRDDLIMVIAKINERRINLFGTQIGMLPQQFFRRPPVVIMFGGEELNFMASLAGPRNSVAGNIDVRVNRGWTHLSTLQRALPLENPRRAGEQVSSRPQEGKSLSGANLPLCLFFSPGLLFHWSPVPLVSCSDRI